MAGKFAYGVTALCDMELKMAPTDTIWLFSFSFDGVFACHFVAPTTPVSIPTDVFAVLPTPVKNLSKMADINTSYPFNSWCIDRL